MTPCQSAAVAALLLTLSVSPLALAETATSPVGSATTIGSGTSAGATMSAQEVKAKLESLGYTQVRDITVTPEGISAKAMKGRKAVAPVVDTNGKVKESQVGRPVSDRNGLLVQGRAGQSQALAGS
jgi:hypothetical protein